MEDEGLTLGVNAPADNEPQKEAPGVDTDSRPEPSESEKALVTEWLGEIHRAKKYHKKAFEQMEKNQYFAMFGADRAWIEGKNYTVALANRHINLAVARLYARDPQAEAKSKRKLRFPGWDGREDTLQAALDGAGMGDPNATQLVQTIIQGRMEEEQIDQMGKTLEILWSYFTSQQTNGFRMQMKAGVRRAKVCKVAYIKLAYQRTLTPRPETSAELEDCTSQIAVLERLLHENAEEPMDETSARLEELKTLMAQLQSPENMVIQEGPVFDFPRSNKVIIDPECVHLKTLTGARYVATEFDLTKDQIEEIYGVDLDDVSSMPSADDVDVGAKTDASAQPMQQSQKKSKDTRYAVYEIQDKRNNQFLTVCDGYHGYLKPPGEPEVAISRFFTIFPIVFNECESDTELYPRSDVELLWDTAMEYNRARQGLREHRRANRPKYAVQAGVLTDVDKSNIASHESQAVFEIQALQPGQKIEDIFQRFPMIGIDPNQYEVQQLFGDIERIVGTQSADFGTSGKETATHASIVQQGQATTLEDNIDDLDEVLSTLAKSTGELMLLNMSKQAVVEIAGPGAVWPETQPTRQDIAKDLYLDIKAGSSGRPNKAAELANIERAAPFLMQIPGVNMTPLALRYAQLLDIDVDDFLAKGLPSATAINAMMAKAQLAPPQQAGGPNAPTNQGPQGAANAPGAPTPEGPQPGMPAPGSGVAPGGGPHA